MAIRLSGRRRLPVKFSSKLEMQQLTQQRYRNAALTILALLALITLLSSCATGYHKQGFTGGYSDYMLTPDTARVMAWGNPATSGEKVNRIAARKAVRMLLRGY
jgi:hypothetical protein